MSERFDSIINDHSAHALNDYRSHINADREEAVLFLANLIEKKERDSIRSKMDNEPHFGALQHMFLGISVRNALRGAGFFYDPHTMDHIWYCWLKEAVSLPDEKVVLTDNVKTRISRYREFIEKERKPQANLSTKHELVSEKVLVASMALLATILFIIPLALDWLW